MYLGIPHAIHEARPRGGPEEQRRLFRGTEEVQYSRLIQGLERGRRQRVGSLTNSGHDYQQVFSTPHRQTYEHRLHAPRLTRRRPRRRRMHGPVARKRSSSFTTTLSSPARPRWWPPRPPIRGTIKLQDHGNLSLPQYLDLSSGKQTVESHQVRSHEKNRSFLEPELGDSCKE